MRTIIKHIFFLIVCMFFVQCDFKPGTPILDELDQDYVLYDYYLDKYGNEGIVCYINPTKSFVVVVSADETYLPWGPVDEAVIKNASSEIWSDKQ